MPFIRNLQTVAQMAAGVRGALEMMEEGLRMMLAGIRVVLAGVRALEEGFGEGRANNTLLAVS